MNADLQQLKLSGDASTPVYRQIKDAIMARIDNGDWPPGHMLPSENELAAQLGASRMTINRPLRELADNGVLKRVHGLGTFVAERPRQQPGHRIDAYHGRQLAAADHVVTQ